MACAPLILSASMINYPSKRRKMQPRFKANSMMQWIEHNWSKTFVNLPSLPWNSEISGVVHLDLTAGRQADRQTGRQTGRQMKSRRISKFLKFTVQRNISIFALFNQDMVSLEQY